MRDFFNFISHSAYLIDIFVAIILAILFSGGELWPPSFGDKRIALITFIVSFVVLYGIWIIRKIISRRH